MKLFLNPPPKLELGQNHRDALARMRKLCAAYTDEKNFTQGACAILQPLFGFDHLLIRFPQPGRRQCFYTLSPALLNSSRMLYIASAAQDRVVASTHKTGLVKILDQKDHAITVASIRHHLTAHPCADFSVIILRHTVLSRETVILGMLSFKKNFFTELHAAFLFELSATLQVFWNRICPKSVNSLPPPSDSGYLSLDRLPGMTPVQEQILAVCRQDCPVLLLGETGSGKEIVANSIYWGSARCYSPFIKVNCGAIPAALIDSKLFGHEQGAFTGAVRSASGCFEMANKGMLFLDELGELDISSQIRLLRVLQEGTFEKVGGTTEVHVDVRIIAATHRNLLDMVKRGKFRDDLLYRLNVFPVYIPALRERPQDIPVLLEYFMLQYSTKNGIMTPPELERSQIRALCDYPWPGNIRELKNAVERAMILWSSGKQKDFRIIPGKEILQCLFDPLTRPQDGGKAPAPASPPPQTPVRPKPAAFDEGPGEAEEDLSLETALRAHILKVINLAGGKIGGKGGAAERLCLNVNTLRAKMKKLGVL